MSINALRNEITITTGLFGTLPKALTFSLDVQGNVAPLRTLTGANVGGASYAVLALDGERILQSGFEP